MSSMNSKLSLHSRVHSMVNLDETTLYTGMEYGAADTWTSSQWMRFGDFTRFTLSSQCRLYLQMNLERTTEMPSAVWWGSCCVSVVFDTKSRHHILPSGRSRTHQGNFCHFCLFTLQITFWSTRRTTQSLSSPLSRWAGSRIKRFKHIINIEHIHHKSFFSLKKSWIYDELSISSVALLNFSEFISDCATVSYWTVKGNI